MSVILQEDIPGAGAKWNCKPVLDRNLWLTHNVGEDNFRAWWESVHSDTFFIRFDREEDATAYKMKWMNNGCN